MPALPSSWLTLLVLPAAYLLYSRTRVPRINRIKRLPADQERVLILGASSGIGKQLALQYAQRGARLCLVARREDLLSSVRDECVAARKYGEAQRPLCKRGDFSVVEDMLGVRQLLEDEWQGVDTLVVCAGISALRSIMEVAGVQDIRDSQQAQKMQDADRDGLQKAVDAGHRVAEINYIGPLLAAVTFIPMLTRSSPSPSILLISSVAGVIPAPTRSLYASSKAASYMLYQSIAIEHPSISFTTVLPGTVKTDFRQGAVDRGPVRETLETALEPDYLVRQAIRAVDNCERVVWMPKFYYWGHLMYYLGLRWFVEKQARKKYGFT